MLEFPETVNSDTSDSKAVKWIYPGAEKAFSEECGLDKDYVNRDAIVEFAAAAFYKYNEASKAIAEIKTKYGDEIAETFKNEGDCNRSSFFCVILQENPYL